MKCSFCGLSKDELPDGAYMVEGQIEPKKYICSNCSKLCRELLDREIHREMTE